MAVSRTRLQSTIAEFWRLLDEYGPTEHLEARWIDLRSELHGNHDAMRDWYYLGHLILDRKNNHGLALKYLISSVQEGNQSPSTPKVRVPSWQGVFLYAAFVASDKAEAVAALRQIYESVDEVPRTELVRFKKLIVEYLELNLSSLISKSMENAIISFFDINMDVSSRHFLTGEEMIKALELSENRKPR